MISKVKLHRKEKRIKKKKGRRIHRQCPITTETHNRDIKEKTTGREMGCQFRNAGMDCGSV